jgi:hypothetical protein
MEKVIGIIFYRDYYDNNQLIWLANKPYKVISESITQRAYMCESETGEIVGMDMINKNRYATIRGK